jgi:hypothetical protein
MTQRNWLPLILGIALAAAEVAAQDPLGSIRSLYASADYEGALNALGRVAVAETTSVALEADRYRVLCLIAVGRDNEANRVIETIVKRDPFFEPGADASPRIRSAFSMVRRRLIPELARRAYADGKAAFGRKDYVEAVRSLEETVQILDSPDAANLSDLSDLRTLAAGFLDLSKASVLPAAETSTTTPPNAVPVPEPPAAPTVAPRTTEPIVLKQVMPEWTAARAGNMFKAEFRGAIEVEIDEHGNVTAATIAKPVHPLYDPVLLKAAWEWKYEPARLAGQPIASTKRVEVVLRPH